MTTENTTISQSNIDTPREQTLRLIRENLTVFAKAMMLSFDITWFHKRYYSALNDFAHGRIKKLMIFIGPQHGKSLGSTRMLPAFLLGLNPDNKVAIVCYNSTKAEKFNREIQRIMDEPAYQEAFPGTQLSNGNDGYSRNNLEFEIIGRQGGVRSVGIGGGLTGETVDILILDDIYKDAQEAWSPIVRDNVENWYSTVAETRLHNNSQQLVVFTRWHHQDLAGRLLSDPNHDWTVISYPAIKVGPPTEDDPREDGAALYPARHDINRLMAIRNRDPFTFESLYQQNPTPREGLLYREFDTYSELPELGAKKAFVDTADTGSDFLCSITYLETTTKIYVIDVIYTQDAMEKTEPLVAEQFSRQRIGTAVIESNNGGRGFARAVEAKCREAGNYHTTITWFAQRSNKESRILTQSAAVNNLIVMPENWSKRWPRFYTDVTMHSGKSKNKHDDAADSLTAIAERFNERSTSNLSALSAFM